MPTGIPGRRPTGCASSLLFGNAIKACARCGCNLKIIDIIEEPAVIAKILTHLERMALRLQPHWPGPVRAF